VGAGGIMLPNHTPLRVVEIFRTLEALHPDRIDLGLGRAPGTDPVTAAALHPSAEQDVDERLQELIAFERGTFPPDHPFSRIKPMPSDVRLPPIWMLGSTLAGASIGASLGVRYAFAGHFAMRYARQALPHYRARFRPSADLATPYAMLAVTVVCGEDDDHAQRLAAPIRLAVVRTRTGRPAPIATVDEALAYRFTPDEQAIADDFLTGAVIGGPDRVRAGLEQLARDTGADELMIATLMADHDERLRSYRRIAQAW
jgi:luciferase family oxidoreductase group 1